MKVNLGCPRYCEGYLCVDLFPTDDRVLRADAIAWLHREIEVEEIKTENLLEHLPNVQEFLKLCYSRLVTGGRIIVVTDNAEWLPFYLPIDIPKSGIGAHSVPSYSLRFNAVHLSIFTKMHLSEHLILAKFGNVRVRRIWRVLGARIEGVGIK